MDGICGGVSGCSHQDSHSAMRTIMAQTMMVLTRVMMLPVDWSDRRDEDEGLRNETR